MAEQTAERGWVTFWQWGLAIVGMTFNTQLIGFFFTLDQVKFLVEIIAW